MHTETSSAPTDDQNLARRRGFPADGRGALGGSLQLLALELSPAISTHAGSK